VPKVLTGQQRRPRIGGAEPYLSWPACEWTADGKAAGALQNKRIRTVSSRSIFATFLRSLQLSRKLKCISQITKTQYAPRNRELAKGSTTYQKRAPDRGQGQASELIPADYLPSARCSMACRS
jgi:hypothetical protein